MGAVKITPISNGVKIFFSVSISGNHDHKKYYPEIISELEKYGQVLTEFNFKNSKTYADAELSTRDIYKRDTILISEADIFVADCTVPSLGVGYEVAYAESLKKPIICIYMSIGGLGLSAMIKGCPNVRVFEYYNMEEMRNILKRELDK